MENQTFKQKIKKEIFDLIKIFVICFVSVYLLTTFLIKPVRVEGNSMYPTLIDGEIGLTNVFAAKFMDINRYDVVIAHNEEEDEYWVKRVIGVPHDTLYVKDDKLYINGEEQEERFLNEEYVHSFQKNGVFTDDFGPITLQGDEYFLMGDNRPKSKDSRQHGVFKRNDITGKGIFILFPFDKIKVVN
ncbi:MAG: signal peptidase I [Erysipelotrichaceae bacterium]|nr:signal peptidase I [Erysipelotrichaceae bacterium]